MRQPTKKCYDCNHCEMCAWRKEVEEQGCEFFDNGNQWIPCSERLPEELSVVNVTYVNHDPEPYYDFVKDIAFTETAVYYRGDWYWNWSGCVDVLAEYGRDDANKVDKAVEVIAWMPLPAPYGGESNG